MKTYCSVSQPFKSYNTLEIQFFKKPMMLYRNIFHLYSQMIWYSQGTQIVICPWSFSVFFFFFFGCRHNCFEMDLLKNLILKLKLNHFCPDLKWLYFTFSPSKVLNCSIIRIARLFLFIFARWIMNFETRFLSQTYNTSVSHECKCTKFDKMIDLKAQILSASFASSFWLNVLYINSCRDCS